MSIYRMKLPNGILTCFSVNFEDIKPPNIDGLDVLLAVSYFLFKMLIFLCLFSGSTYELYVLFIQKSKNKHQELDVIGKIFLVMFNMCIHIFLCSFTSLCFPLQVPCSVIGTCAGSSQLQPSISASWFNSKSTKKVLILFLTPLLLQKLILNYPIIGRVGIHCLVNVLD